MRRGHGGFEGSVGALHLKQVRGRGKGWVVSIGMDGLGLGLLVLVAAGPGMLSKHLVSNLCFRKMGSVLTLDIYTERVCGGTAAVVVVVEPALVSSG